MYRTCIYCSATLGTNDAVEEFPVGRTLAFDGEKGRLWAVCRACARWNLAPIEERWEAIEAAERLFRDCAVRVQAENVGMARLRDGTRLVRVGAALPGELAVWRYGRIATRRRIYSLAGRGATAAVALGLAPVIGLLPFNAVWDGLSRGYRAEEIIGRLRVGPEDRSGQDLFVRDLHGVRTRAGADGALEVEVSVARLPWPVHLAGSAARDVLARALVQINRAGAARDEVDHAVDTLAARGGAEPFLRELAAGEYSLAPWDARRRASDWWNRDLLRRWKRKRDPAPPLLSPLFEHGPLALCAEMAVHEEQERRAMDGELAALEGMWREAEQIAAIADRLPDGD